MSDPKNKQDAIAEMIRRYCVDHPRAADTLDGVRGWIGADYRSLSSKELGAVLEALVLQGIVTRRLLADGTTLYFSSVPGSGSG